MDKKVTVSEFKAKSLGLFEEVATKGLEIIVTKRGKEIAVVIPIAKYKKKREAGRLRLTLVEEKDVISPIGESNWEVLK